MNAPMKYICLLLLAGIVAGREEGWWIVVAIMLWFVLCTIVLVQRHNRLKWVLCAMFAIAVLSGFVLSSMHKRKVKLDMAMAMLSGSTHAGRVTEVRRNACVVTTDGHKCLLSMDKDNMPNHIAIGNTIVWHGRLRPYAMDNFWLNRGVNVYSRAYSYCILRTQPDNVIDRWHNAVLQRIDALDIRPQTKALMGAMLVADRSSVDEKITEAFRNAGASHLLALSGTHLAVLIGSLVLLLGYDVRERWRNLLLTTSILWMYVAVASAPLSLVRAASLYTAILTVKAMRRRVEMLDALWLVMILFMIFRPWCVYDIGVQLSFAAVAGLGLSSGWKPFVSKPAIASMEWLWKPLLVSATCSIFTMPFVWYTFGHIQLYSAISSLILVPMAFFFIILSVVAMAVPCGCVLDCCTEAMIAVASFFAQLPLSVI